MLCSAKIANDGPTFTGRLQKISGGTELEVINRIKAQNPGASSQLLPIMLQAARPIWFDTAFALAGLLLLGLGGLWLLLRGLLMKVESWPAEPRVDPHSVR